MSVQITMTKAEYVQHHLTNWQLNLHNMTFTNGGFWTLNLDTILMSLILGGLFFFLFYLVARKARVNKPSRIQNFVEMSVESVGKIVKETTTHNQTFIAALGLTVFAWIFLMNCMDLVPVDLIPRIALLSGAHYFRAVPTVDPMQTFAMSISVFLLVIYYNIRMKGGIGLLKEILTRPFGKYLFVANVFFRLTEELVKPISLSLRLFGNLFAGEIVFVLISALISSWWGRLGLGLVWTGFHLIVITIQAFIFMMLTIVYLGMAQEAH